ncbi:flagellar basal body rod protein FlgC [Yoonia sp. 2307UL14-13]|uniref:flagellar basal body rod protein FlgC n=1 Tax=Yoonia sp. 2307UL14-13 TaxID=3126506 RepID=UPI0030A16C9B
MSDFSEAMSVASSGMKAQANRLRHVSENIANVDTPGYRRKTIAFQEAFADSQRTGAVETGKVRLDRAELTRIYDPGNPLSDTSGHYNGSNVNMLIEIADAREAQRSYQANLKMFDQVRQMSSALMDLLRR